MMELRHRDGWDGTPEFQRHSSTSREVRERLGANRTTRPTWFVGPIIHRRWLHGRATRIPERAVQAIGQHIGPHRSEVFLNRAAFGLGSRLPKCRGRKHARHSTIFKYHRNTPTMPPSSRSHPGLSQGSKTSVILGIVRNNSLFIRSMEGAL